MVSLSRRGMLLGSVGLALGAGAVGATYLSRDGSQPPEFSIEDDSLTASGIAFSPDGGELAVPADSGVRRWSTVTWRELPPVTLEPMLAYALGGCSYGPDGRLMAVAAGNVFIVDPSTAAVRQTLGPSGSAVQGPQTGVLTAANGQTMGVVGPAQQAPAATSVAFAANGKWLAAAEDTGAISIFAIADGEVSTTPLRRLTSPPGANGSKPVCFSPQSSILATAVPADGIQLWTTESWDPGVVMMGPNSGSDPTLAGTCLAFSADGSYVASGLATLGVWRVRDGGLAYDLTSLVPNGCGGLAFAGSSRLVVGDQSGTVTLWDLPRRSAIRSWTTPDSPLTCVATSPDGAMAAVGSEGGFAVWPIPS